MKTSKPDIEIGDDIVEGANLALSNNLAVIVAVLGLVIVVLAGLLFSVKGKLNGRKKIKTENTHDRLRVNNISSGRKIRIEIRHGNNVDKVTDIFDRIELDINRFHIVPQSAIYLV